MTPRGPGGSRAPGKSVDPAGTACERNDLGVPHDLANALRIERFALHDLSQGTAETLGERGQHGERSEPFRERQHQFVELPHAGPDSVREYDFAIRSHVFIADVHVDASFRL